MPRFDEREEERKEIGELYHALENRNRDVTDLETRLQHQQNQLQQQQQRRSFFDGRGGGGHSSSYGYGYEYEYPNHEEDAENLQIRQENIKYRKLISELQAELSQGDDTESEIRQLHKQVESQRSLIDSQRRKLLDAERRYKKEQERSKSTTGEIYKLETENLRLRESTQEYEQSQQDLVAEVELLAGDRYELELNVQAKEREIEDFVGSMEEKDVLCHSLESENSLLLSKIKTFEEKEEGWKV